jgi:hypothetical protein
VNIDDYSVGIDFGEEKDTCVVSIYAPDGLRPRLVSHAPVTSGPQLPEKPGDGAVHYDTQHGRFFVFHEAWQPLTGPETLSVVSDYTSNDLNPPGSRKLNL